MICGHGPYYRFSISPHGGQFVITPALNEDTILKVVWDGLKNTFADSDEVPFPVEAAEAVAAYVMWKIMLTVDKNIPLAREWEAEYVKKRLALFRDWNEGRFPDGQDEEYHGQTSQPPVDSEIDSWTELAAIPTTDLPVGTVKIWVNTAEGLMKGTQLLAGTDATDTANGIQRPDDYAAGTNEKVWYNRLA
jgi:hypothetical protein